MIDPSGIHFSYPAKSIGEWLRLAEMHHSAHFIRGLFLGLGLWIFGLRHWTKYAILGSLLGVFIFSGAWELYDWSRDVQSDGFDIADIVFDSVGALSVQLIHWCTHKFDR